MAEPRTIPDASEKHDGFETPTERDSIQASADEEAIQERIRTELIRELVRHPLDALPRNRWLVNELYRRLCGTEPFDAEDLNTFLTAAAAVMREEFFERACRASSRTKDTVADSDPRGVHSTVVTTRVPSVFPATTLRGLPMPRQKRYWPASQTGKH